MEIREAEGLEPVPFRSDLVELSTHGTVSKGDERASSIRGFPLEGGDGDIGTADPAVSGLEFNFMGDHGFTALGRILNLKKDGVIRVENFIEALAEDGLRGTFEDATGLRVDLDYLVRRAKDYDAIGERFDDLFQIDRQGGGAPVRAYFLSNLARCTIGATIKIFEVNTLHVPAVPGGGRRLPGLWVDG